MFLQPRNFLCIIMLLEMIHSTAVLAGSVRVYTGANAAGITIGLKVKSIKELRERGITLQKLDYSCGSAALSTLCTSYINKPYSEQTIIDEIVKNGDIKKIAVRKGFSLLDLKRFAGRHGIAADGYALDYPSLLDLHCPVLVPLMRKDINLRHFVIFRGADHERVFLADPAVGRRTMTRVDFLAEWNPRVGMVFHPIGMTPPLHHGLELGPEDATYMTTDRLRAILMASVMQDIHKATEYGD